MTSLLPPNATNLEKALCHAVSMPASPVPYHLLWSADDCPLDLLPWLAGSLGVRTWLPDWPEAVKRERVRQAIPLKRRLGSRKSVEDVVATLGATADIDEWFETDPPGTPRTFAVALLVEDDPPSAPFLNSVIADITRAKPLGAHFTFAQKVTARARLAAIASARLGNYLRLAMTAD